MPVQRLRHPGCSSVISSQRACRKRDSRPISAQQRFFVRGVILWITSCVGAAFYFAFDGELELTLVWGSMALCLSPALWLYLALWELRQNCRNQDAVIEKLRRRLQVLEPRERVTTHAGNERPQLSKHLPIPRADPPDPKSLAPSPAHTSPKRSDHRIARKQEALPTGTTNPKTATASSRRDTVVGHQPGSNRKRAPGPHILGPPQEMGVLRNRFAEQIRAEQFAAALATGDEIVAKFPNRRPASDFLQLRHHLLRRVEASQHPTLGG